MNYEFFLAERLAKLRLNRGISARDMSLSIGQSPNYINKIENHKNLPSMTMFFYICEYLQISPDEFFRIEEDDPKQHRRIEEKLSLLNERQLYAVEIMIDTLLDSQQVE